MITTPLDDLDAWVSYFSEAQIPVMRHTMHALDEMRDNAENVNARVLSTIILQDPLLTLRVLGYIERNRRNSQTTDITTIERALMMIGINPFFREFNELPLIEDQLKQHPKALLGLLKVISRARKAAAWSREWAIARRDVDVDEITVAALLHDFAEILMWCFAPTLAIQVRETQLADRTLRSVAVQEEVYGLPLYQVKEALAKAWRLPSLLTMLMASENAENPRVRNVKIAVDMARHSANGWDDPALPDDFKAVEELIHIGHEHLLLKLGVDPSQLYRPPESTVTTEAAPASDAHPQ